MMNSIETKSCSTTILMVPISDPSSTEHTTFVSPMPRQVTFGHLTLTNDQEAFLQAFDAGMQSYYELDYEKQQMTAQALLNDLLETIHCEDTPLAWRLGFIAGEIAGILNPDIAVTEAHTPCLEVLTRKCQALYPGPELVSTYLHALYQAIGLDLIEVETVPSSCTSCSLL